MLTFTGVVSGEKNAIEYDPDFRLNWEFSLDGQTWEPAGMTETPVYIGHKTPIQEPIFYRTVVHLGVVSATGITETDVTSDAAAVGAIWSEFSDRSVKHWNGGNAMTYWGAVVPPAVSTSVSESSRTLLAFGDGTCGTWARFFRAVVGTQGIGSNHITVTPKDQGSLLVVNDIAFVGGGTVADPNHPDYAYILGIDAFEQRVPGQGGNPSQFFFNNHAIVAITINGAMKYYDPSYGNSPYATQEAWEAASLAGLAIPIQIGNTGTLLIKKESAALDTTFGAGVIDP